MKVSMHSMSAPVFVRMLTNLSNILDKAAVHAETKKIDPAVFLNSRMIPDMLPFTKQVQIACDFAKGAVARLCGEEPPKWDDNEASFADLKQRIARTIEFVQAHQPAQFEGSEERTIELKIRGETIKLPGHTYLANMAMPNFYFHVTTAYDLLRKDGVEIGKRDFIGG